uniref:Atos homolog protein A n=1 Tax=Oncorhynchus mykiss TaxID=8022 RepID=A0A8K9XU75_ONCMY
MYPRQNVSDQCFSFPLLPDVVVEEFFEYDAEDFLVFLTLLITEGRTPECSVKGRTEGLHCPPAKSALPPLHRHECSDKLPQCVQARRVRSEVCVLWRNSIPIMVEVMLLPDCCYGDESPPSDPISDPAIKQDALLLERWTLQPVPRQSGDRFIEEKTLLLAVRSYVFFSQLSAWLSASHGIVPRNILYRISAADEECVCQFSQPPAEHLFPVPNVSQSVALRLRVQSLPRQPTYPTLACSIHTGLTLAPLYSKTPSLNQNGSDLPRVNKGQTSSAYHLPISPRPSPRPHRKLSSTLPLPPGGKTVRWLYSLTSDPSDDITHTTEDYGKAVNGAESSKGRGSEAPRAFKTYSLAEPPRCPSPRPSSETNPLIGSLLQERQEVIARIAQRLNFCDPTAPHLPPALFTPDTPTKTPVRSSYLGNTTLSKTKGPEGAPPTEDTPPSPFDTPIVCVKRVEESEEPQPLFSASAPPASLSLLGNFEECVLNYRLEPLGSVEGFMAEVGASGTFCPSHMTFPVDVSFYSISDDNAPSPYMGVINLETLGKRGYRVPPSGTIQVTLFNPNKTVVKMFVVVYDLRAMPAGHQTFLRQRTFSVPVRRDTLSLGQERILRYLIHLRFQTSRSGKVYLHRDIRLLFSRKSMEVDSGAAYELKSYTESPADPAFSPRC